MIRKIKSPHDTFYKNDLNEFHNPHRPAADYTINGYDYYINGKKQNIVGHARKFNSGSYSYFINNKPIN